MHCSNRGHNWAERSPKQAEMVTATRRHLVQLLGTSKAAVWLREYDSLQLHLPQIYAGYKVCPSRPASAAGTQRKHYWLWVSLNRQKNSSTEDVGSFWIAMNLNEARI
ncbi:hypothetical protein ACJJTC_004037 [Scirpophaga incertulas]